LLFNEERARSLFRVKVFTREDRGTATLMILRAIRVVVCLVFSPIVIIKHRGIIFCQVIMIISLLWSSVMVLISFMYQACRGQEPIFIRRGSSLKGVGVNCSSCNTRINRKAEAVT